MAKHEPISADRIETSRLLMIVVGAHLRAEIADRPLAGRLRDNIQSWLRERGTKINAPFLPLICCDIWYLNQERLHQCPTISVGGPGVNALSAFFQNRLNAAFVRDNHLIIQLDPEFVDLRACIWGVNHELTVTALETFDGKYLDRYLRAVASQIEPQVD